MKVFWEQWIKGWTDIFVFKQIFHDCLYDYICKELLYFILVMSTKGLVFNQEIICRSIYIICDEWFCLTWKDHAFSLLFLCIFNYRRVA